MDLSRPDGGWRKGLRIFYGLFYLGSGVNHFVKPDFYMPMMPPYLPAHLQLIYLSGVAELIVGAALIYTKTVRAGAWGIMALLLAVLPAHIHMLVHQEDFADIPPAALWARIPIQGLLMWWAYVYTRPARAGLASA